MCSTPEETLNDALQKVCVLAFVIVSTIMLTAWNILPGLGVEEQRSIHASALTFGRVPLFLVCGVWVLLKMESLYGTTISTNVLLLLRMVYGVALAVSIYWIGFMIWHGARMVGGAS